MPKPYPAEFRRDVVAVARKNDAPAFPDRQRLRRQRGDTAQLTQEGRHRGRNPSWCHRRPSFRDPGDEAADASTRARKRSAAPRCAVSLAGEPAKKLMYPLVRELVATDTPIRVPVAVTCRILCFSKQAFYHWLREPVSDRTWDEAHLSNAAYDLPADDPASGYRFVAEELAEQGFTASERRVRRLCSQHELWSSFAKRGGRGCKTGPPVHDDHVQRKFTAPRPNQLWLTDHRTPDRIFRAPSQTISSSKDRPPSALNWLSSLCITVSTGVPPASATTLVLIRIPIPCRSSSGKVCPPWIHKF